MHQGTAAGGLILAQSDRLPPLTVPTTHAGQYGHPTIPPSENRSFFKFSNDLRMTLKKSEVPSPEYLSQYSSPVPRGFDEFWENFSVTGICANFDGFAGSCQGNRVKEYVTNR